MLKTQSYANKRERMEQSDNQGADDQPHGYTVIENCPMAFECPKKWEALASTEDPKVRHCDECNLTVTFCPDSAELEKMIAAGACVSFFVAAEDKPTRMTGVPDGGEERGAAMRALLNHMEPNHAMMQRRFSK